jgi:2-methylcitrate dehydratase PrpD
MSKGIGVGNAAKNGLAAALFAEAGFTGPEQPLEGRYGFAPVTSESISYDLITGKLGESWEILSNAYKPYPCGVVLFPVIDACLELRRRMPAAEQIAQVIVRGHPLLLERADRPAVETGREAKVSIQHSVAVAFLDGAAGLAQYADRRVADPAVRALRARVAVEEDAGVPVESAIVTLQLADGSSFTEQVRDGRGTPGRPMSDDELDGKVRELAAFGAPFVDAPALITAIRGIEEESDAGRIVGLAVPPPQ